MSETKRPGLTKERRAWLAGLLASTEAVEVMLVTKRGPERIDTVEPSAGLSSGARGGGCRRPASCRDPSATTVRPG